MCAYAVALKQLLPEIEMPLLGGIGGMSVRYKHLPIIFLSTAIFFHLLRVPSTYVLFTVFGFSFSWIYLRFFQTRDGFTGDTSDQFAFATFLPPTLQYVRMSAVGLSTSNNVDRVSFAYAQSWFCSPVAVPVGNVLWKLFCGCGCGSTGGSRRDAAQAQPSRVVDMNKYSGFSVLDQPGDADRRRQLGLKALDARMASIKASPAPKSSFAISSVLNTQPGRTIPGITTSASIDVAPQQEEV